MYTFVFLYKPLVYRGLKLIVTHGCHLGFQGAVQPLRT